MTQKTATRIIKKIGESHVVWFGESNRWLELREPAWFVYHKHEAGENEESLVVQLSGRYGLPGEEALRFYREIIDGIRLSSRPGLRNDPRPARLADTEVFGARKFRSRHYLLNGKPVTISYGSQELEHYIHRPLAWLETENPADDSLHLRAVKYCHSSVPEKQNPVSHAAKTWQPHVSVQEDPGNPSNKCIHPQSPAKKSSRSTGAEPGYSADRTAPPQSPADRSARSPGGEPEYPSSSGIKYALQVDEETVYHFNDPGFLKHKLYVLITGHIYGIPENEWMSYIHASAISNGTEAILLSSASGSGKSTMAAMLQLPFVKEGMPQAGDLPSQLHPSSEPDEKAQPQKASVPSAILQSQKVRVISDAACSQQSHKARDTAGLTDLYFVSDDFVPVDAVNLKAHVFPAALTAKKGSFTVIDDYYHKTADADAKYSPNKNPDIRYLRPRLAPGEPYRPLEVKKIIFIRYNPGVTFEMEKLPVISALTLFHEEAWVSHNPDHVRRFVDWFVTLTCYRVEYSDMAVAMQAIRELFENISNP